MYIGQEAQLNFWWCIDIDECVPDVCDQSFQFCDKSSLKDFLIKSSQKFVLKKKEHDNTKLLLV